MRRFAFSAFVLAASLAGPVSHAQSWPSGIDRLEPAVSQSKFKAEYSTQPIVPPDPSVAPDKAKWSGKWEGWACQGFSCDVKLTVLSVTNEGAKVAPGFGGTNATAPTRTRDAVFVGNELHVVEGNPKWYFRMRKSGEVEVLRTTDNGGMGYGVLTKAE